MARRVLKKIDRVIIPLLFCTYIFNFADKVILSSAAVFGLREDNVSASDKFDERHLQSPFVRAETSDCTGTNARNLIES